MSALDRFNGGGRLMLVAGAVGLVGLLLTFVGMAFDTQRALYAYLAAFAYWTGIAVAMLLLLASFHATHAKWVVVIRRPVEAMSTAIFPLAVLFLPIALGMQRLFVWVAPPATLDEHVQHLIHHKHAYLNVPFFLVRAVLYFAVWAGVAHLLHRWSLRQDEAGGVRLTLRQRRLAAGSLPAVVLALTFAAFDWLMSLHPEWFSTIFAVYWFAGSFLAAVACLVVATVYWREPNLFSAHVSTAHLHNLGKLLLAFTAFWAYIAFSQFLLMWIAHLPEEITWYGVRARGAWYGVSIALAVCHFVLPFIVLLSRRLKEVPRKLGLVAIWILLVHYLDIYWLVMPALLPEGPALHWTDLTALLGIGGVAVAFTVWRLRGNYTVPVKDPYLAESLGYHQP